MTAEDRILAVTRDQADILAAELRRIGNLRLPLRDKCHACGWLPCRCRRAAA